MSSRPSFDAEVSNHHVPRDEVPEPKHLTKGGNSEGIVPEAEQTIRSDPRPAQKFNATPLSMNSEALNPVGEDDCWDWVSAILGQEKPNPEKSDPKLALAHASTTPAQPESHPASEDTFWVNWECPDPDCLWLNSPVELSCGMCSTSKPTESQVVASSNVRIPTASSVSAPVRTTDITVSTSPSPESSSTSASTSAATFPFSVPALKPVVPSPTLSSNNEDDHEKPVSHGDMRIPKKTSETPKSFSVFAFGEAKGDSEPPFSFGSAGFSSPTSKPEAAPLPKGNCGDGMDLKRFWVCPVCAVSNRTERFTCAVCSESKPSGVDETIENVCPVSEPKLGLLWSTSANKASKTSGRTSGDSSTGTAPKSHDGPRKFFPPLAPAEWKTSGIFNSLNNMMGVFNFEKGKNMFGGSNKPADSAAKPVVTLDSTGFEAASVSATTFGSLTMNAEKPVGFRGAAPKGFGASSFSASPVFGSQTIPMNAEKPVGFRGAAPKPKPGGSFGFPEAPSAVKNPAPNPSVRTRPPPRRRWFRVARSAKNAPNRMEQEPSECGEPQPKPVRSANPAPKFPASPFHSASGTVRTFRRSRR